MIFKIYFILPYFMSILQHSPNFYFKPNCCNEKTLYFFIITIDVPFQRPF